MSLAAEDRFSLAESRISARCVIVSASSVIGRRVCSRRPSRGLSGQPTAVAWCELVIRRLSSVVSTDDDRRTDENRMVCA